MRATVGRVKMEDGSARLWGDCVIASQLEQEV